MKTGFPLVIVCDVTNTIEFLCFDKVSTFVYVVEINVMLFVRLVFILVWNTNHINNLPVEIPEQENKREHSLQLALPSLAISMWKFHSLNHYHVKLPFSF